MIEGPFLLALTAGMVAALNPCGFAMLPAYLTYFVGSSDDGAERGRAAEILRALAVAGVLTTGFVVVFGAFGLITTPFALSIERHLPWVTIVIGIALVGLGVAMALGRQLTLTVPKLQRGGAGRELPSMFLFGVSYAVASLSCTIGPFLAVTTSTFRSVNYLSGVLVFVVYGLGMGLLVGALTLAVAGARTTLVTSMRRALPWVTRLSGALLVVAGAYVAWYGWWEVRILRGELVDDPVAGFGEDVRARVNEWILDVGALRLAVVLGAVLGLALLGALAWRRREAGVTGAPEVEPVHGEPEPARR